MALSSKDKIQLMKDAYASGYKGSFTDLFKQADPEWDQDPELNQDFGNNMPDPSMMQAPSDTQTQNAAMMPTGPESKETQQGLVQSYETAPTDQMPTGDDIKTVIEQPSQYNYGGYRISEMIENDYDATSNPDAYTNNYTNNYMNEYQKGGKKKK